MFQGWLLKKTLLLSAASFILMLWCSKLLNAMIFKATETLGGAPVILWVRRHGIMKSLAHKEEN